MWKALPLYPLSIDLQATPAELCPLPGCLCLIEAGLQGSVLLLLHRREDVKDRDPGTLETAPASNDVVCTVEGVAREDEVEAPPESIGDIEARDLKLPLKEILDPLLEGMRVKGKLHERMGGRHPKAECLPEGDGGDITAVSPTLLTRLLGRRRGGGGLY